MLSEADIERAGGVTSPKLATRLFNEELVRTGGLPANHASYPLRGGGEYYGQIASNCRISSQQATDGISVYWKSHHKALVAVTEIAVVLSGWFNNRAVDKKEGGAQSPKSVSVSIEYPAGVKTLLTFSKRRQGRVDMASEACSDFLEINIPAGAEFWICAAEYMSAGYLCKNMAMNTAIGEGSTASTTRVADRTEQIGSDPASRSSNTWPQRIISRTTHGGVCSLGDSIVDGTGDSFTTPLADTAAAGDGWGLIGRAVSNRRAHINGGVAGDDLETCIQGGNTNFRMSQLAYVKNGIMEWGVNSISNGATLTAMRVNMLTLWNRAATFKRPDGRLFQTTIGPNTTSTDSWATLANQTVKAGEAVRVAVNDWLRAGAPILGGVPVDAGTVGAIIAGQAGHPLYHVFDTASAFESSLNSGKWKVDGTAFKYTGDGLHPNQTGYNLGDTSGAIDHSYFA
ncbi:SGNH/GDSL hydrolase family protein [Ancylobacter oerskovii]|nr:SGNH/GDSL hydrolase family protein [Ancylobacter oerskovii]MBS7546261.1 SGNH/GDSL hydrolase family protein [Ancylobacter oerskovii]